MRFSGKNSTAFRAEWISLLKYSYTLQKILHESDGPYKDFELVFSSFLFFLARLAFYRFLSIGAIFPVVAVITIVVVVAVVVVVIIVVL